MSMITIVKFIHRDGVDPKSNLIPVKTRTCMKIGLIAANWTPPKEMEELPKHGEFWMVQIVHETNVGMNTGCLFLHPIRKVEVSELNKLVPGFFTDQRPNPSTAIVYPQELPHSPWILPLSYKRDIAAREGLSTIVVCLGGEYWAMDKGGHDGRRHKKDSDN